MSLPRDYRPPPVSPDEPIEPWPLHPRMVLLVGLTCWIVSYGLSETTISDAGRQALFIPAGISVGLLLRLPGRLWVWVLAVMATVDLVGGVLLTTLDSALIWAPANVIQTLVVAAALRWLRVDMTRTRDPFLIAVVAAIVVTLVAIPGSLALARAQQIDPTQFWADWWGSDVVAILLVVPVILLVGRATLPRGRLAVEAGGWFALSAAVVTALFLDDGLWVPVWIWLVIGAPLMVLYGVRFGLLAMTGALLILDSRVQRVSATVQR